jgi:hypothetical protein
VTSWNQWNNKERILKIPTGSNGTAGAIAYRLKLLAPFVPLKLGFDQEFNPVCQFQGHLFDPKSMKSFSFDQNSFHTKMEPSWMLEISNNLYKGDRLRGFNEERYGMRISVTEETIGNQRMWVLDIVNLKSQQGGL